MEHNQLVIADKLGVPMATPPAVPGGNQPAEAARPSVQRKRSAASRLPARRN
jgi:hypothetical protein